MRHTSNEHTVSKSSEYIFDRHTDRTLVFEYMFIIQMNRVAERIANMEEEKKLFEIWYGFLYSPQFESNLSCTRTSQYQK